MHGTPAFRGAMPALVELPMVHATTIGASSELSWPTIIAWSSKVLIQDALI
jgi:hypothetical protein